MPEIETSYRDAMLESMVRELRWMLRWAVEEPEYLPAQYDEDTGEVAPVLNNRAINQAMSVAQKFGNIRGKGFVRAQGLELRHFHGPPGQDPGPDLKLKLPRPRAPEVADELRQHV